MDTLNTAKKTTLQTKTAALKVAIALTDPSARENAIQAANKAAKAADHTAMKAFQDATKATREAVRTACQGLLSNGSGRGIKAGMMENMTKGKGAGFFGAKAGIKEMMKSGKMGGRSSSTASAQ